jgi:hypothetical protein
MQRHDDTTTRRHDDTTTRRHDDTTTRRHDDTRFKDNLKLDKRQDTCNFSYNRLRTILQALLLLLTMKAAAINYYAEMATCNHLLADSHQPTAATLDCGFLVTSAVILSNGNYEVCAQATAQFAAQNWQVWNGFAPPAIATSN